MLTFVGLGLYDERSVTVEGQAAIGAADAVFAEFYTSRLTGTTIERLEDFHGTEIEVLGRAGIEQEPEPILKAAATGDAAFLTAGDPMISTTHIDLRLRAFDRGIETRIVHGTTAQAAASSLTGLQNYRFGKSTTVPFPKTFGKTVPISVVETINGNRARGLHTLVFLDIDADENRYLRADEAATHLAEVLDDGLMVAVARAGSPDPIVEANRCTVLGNRDFGGPLHLLVVPGELHELEAEALRSFANAPVESLP